MTLDCPEDGGIILEPGWRRPRAGYFSLLQNMSRLHLWSVQPLSPWIPGLLPQRQSSRVVMLATHFRLLSMLRIYGALSPLSAYAFVANTGKTLPYLYAPSQRMHLFTCLHGVIFRKTGIFKVNIAFLGSHDFSACGK
jgi:hypothetical protein